MVLDSVLVVLNDPSLDRKVTDCKLLELPDSERNPVHCSADQIGALPVYFCRLAMVQLYQY